MKNSQSINSSMPEYWEKSYQSGDMGWDLGGPTPIFNDWIQFQTDSLSICILGAGNGWDAINFAEKGHNVTAVDFAESAIDNMHTSAQSKGVQINIVHSDIFDLCKLFNHTFDIVLEYTCFCAIDPGRRMDYVRMTNQILKPDGKLVALLFPIDQDVNDDGPPFTVDLNSTINLFSKYFTLDTKEIPSLSIQRRNGREIFVIFKKNGN
tara:strand:- start:5 stop:628 length:624 start_codon:yes stop_codon:yes gene_type:complete